MMCLGRGSLDEFPTNERLYEREHEEDWQAKGKEAWPVLSTSCVACSGVVDAALTGASSAVAGSSTW